LIFLLKDQLFHPNSLSVVIGRLLDLVIKRVSSNIKLFIYYLFLSTFHPFFHLIHHHFRCILSYIFTHQIPQLHPKSQGHPSITKATELEARSAGSSLSANLFKGVWTLSFGSGARLLQRLHFRPPTTALHHREQVAHLVTSCLKIFRFFCFSGSSFCECILSFLSSFSFFLVSDVYLFLSSFVWLFLSNFQKSFAHSKVT